MKLWIDADACPRKAKELIFQAAERFSVETVLVANSKMSVPRSARISMMVVEGGHNKADDFIAEGVAAGDLVVTADIPLAARIVERGALGIDPRGQIYNEDNIAQKLAVRNLLAELRGGGLMGGGPPPYKDKDRHKFGVALDRLLTKLISQSMEQPEW